MMFRADLHCHTTCSDGALTPEELIAHAKARGLKGLSITDHDTVAAYRTAPACAQRWDIALGTGIEISASFLGKSVHVLGYDISINDAELLAFCAAQQEIRRERNAAMLERLRRYRMEISEQELSVARGTIGRVHIAKCMVAKGYVPSISAAFYLHIGDGKPCFVPLKTPSVEKAIEIIHNAGGKAFLAHPHLSQPKAELLSLPFDGIECYYAMLPPEREKKWLREAEKRGLLISGGSDFHAMEGSPLGASWVNESCFHAIFRS